MRILAQGDRQEGQAYFLLLHKVHDSWTLSRRRRVLGNVVAWLELAGASSAGLSGIDVGAISDMMRSNWTT